VQRSWQCMLLSNQREGGCVDGQNADWYLHKSLVWRSGMRLLKNYQVRVGEGGGGSCTGYVSHWVTTCNMDFRRASEGGEWSFQCFVAMHTGFGFCPGKLRALMFVACVNLVGWSTPVELILFLYGMARKWALPSCKHHTGGNCPV
jgi:hypothetical protein